MMANYSNYLLAGGVAAVAIGAYLYFSGSGSSGSGSLTPTGAKLKWDWAGVKNGREALHILESWDRLTTLFDPGDRVVVRDKSGNKISRARIKDLFIDGESMMLLDKPEGFANDKGPGNVQKLT
jgi:hypothetical protein